MNALPISPLNIDSQVEFGLNYHQLSSGWDSNIFLNCLLKLKHVVFLLFLLESKRVEKLRFHRRSLGYQFVIKAF